MNRHVSVSVTWAVAGLMLWASVPGATCVCATGAVKLICNNHGDAWQRSVAGARVIEDCCSTSPSPAVRDCCDSASSPGGCFSKQGCRLLTHPPAVVGKVSSSQAKLDQNLVASATTLDAPRVHDLPVPTIRAWFNTGPPVDLVVQLHCLLI